MAGKFIGSDVQRYLENRQIFRRIQFLPTVRVLIPSLCGSLFDL